MTQKFTAAHWGGAYEVQGPRTALHLSPLSSDPNPSRIGAGWLDAMQNTQTRILRPAIRKGWLQGRDRARGGDAEFVELPLG